MKKSVILISLGSFLTLGVMPAAIAQNSLEDPQDPAVGGQLNQCWGDAASQTAKLSTPDGTSGGGMGQHSRSTTAADINGGFASSDTPFQFNADPGQEGGNGRLGVGNATRSDPHNVQPGDGGNGQHGINNIDFSNPDPGTGFPGIDPVTGQFGSENPLQPCS